MYVAEKSKGAYLNDKKIMVPATSVLTQRIVMLSSSYGINLASVYGELLKIGCKPIVTYSVIQHASLVATGEVAAVISGSRSIQDVLPISLLIEEAGGMVTDLRGKRYDKIRSDAEGLIVASAHIHAKIFDLASKYLLPD